VHGLLLLRPVRRRSGNSATETNGGSFFTFETGKKTNVTFVSTDVPKTINDMATITSTITVADAKTART